MDDKNVKKGTPNCGHFPWTKEWQDWLDNLNKSKSDKKPDNNEEN